MPVKQSFEIKAKAVKQGDYVTHYGEVLSRDSKVKWTTITFQPKADFAETLRVENDADMTVIREVPTEEEKAAKELQRTLVALDFKEQQARANLAHRRERMIKGLEAGKRASYSDWMDVPEAEALVDLWDAVAHVHKVRAERDDLESITRVEAIRLVRDERRKQALSYYRALSRSTSIVSNLFDDLKIEALSAWAREMAWILFEE